jgi:hypothetical protein
MRYWRFIMISKILRKISISFLMVLISVQTVFGNEFCLVSKIDDRKFVISNGKDEGINSVNRFTFFSSTNRNGSSLDGYVNSEKYHKKEMLECFSVETPSSLFPTQYIESLDPYYEGSVKDIVFITSYCLVNDFYKSEPPNYYQYYQRTDYQILTYYPNKGEDSDDSVNLSVRSIYGLCGNTDVGKTNELNDDLYECYWNEQMVWV